MQTARDTFTVYMEENLKDPRTSSALPINVFKIPQQKVRMNALNIRYLTDTSVAEARMWDLMAQLDIYVGDEDVKVDGESIFPDRVSVETWQEAVLSALSPGKTDGVYVRALGISGGRGAWHYDRGYICWHALEGMSFKDMPEESYIRKVLTLNITYFK